MNTSWLRCFLTVGTALFAVNPFSAYGQPYPSKPIRIIVPGVPGGPSDIQARMIGEKLAVRLKQQVIVENRPGPGGLIGFEAAAKAPPDGYTLVFGDTHALGMSGVLGRRYDPIRDFTPVSLVSRASGVLLVRPSLNVNSVRELIALAKSKPGQIKFTSPGIGTQAHLAGEQFRNLTGAPIQHVPYKGSGGATTALVGGEVEVAFASVREALALAQAGKAKLLAVTGATRSRLAPQLPTVAESGVAGFDMVATYGFFLPARAPREIVGRLNSEIVSIVNQPDMREKLAQVGAEPVGTTPEQLGDFVRKTSEQWARAAKAEGGEGAGAAAGPPALLPPAPPVAAVLPGAPPAAAKPPGAAAPPPHAPPVAAVLPGAPPAAAKPPAPPTRPPLTPPMNVGAGPALPAAGDGGDVKPATPPKQAQLADAYWNSWFQRDGTPVVKLQKDKAFVFVLDISKFQYDKRRSSRADLMVQEKLRLATDEHVEFVVRPILVGGVLEFPGGKVPDDPRITVTLDRLRIKDDETAEQRLFSAYREGKLPLTEFSEATRAGVFAFRVLATGDGCASVALSIWDEAGKFPLDQLVHTVEVGAGPQDGTECAKDGSELRGGLATLLDVSLDRGPGMNDALDAALHVFEFPYGSGKRSVAVFIDKARFETAPASAVAAERGIFSWILKSTLSSYLAMPGQMFREIDGARGKTENQRNAYDVVAGELAVKIFSGLDEQDKIAKSALASLKDIVRKAKRRPLVIVRMFTADNDPVYLPLALLAARGKERVLAKPATFAQPLPRERYVAGKSCIDPWTFGIPRRLSGVGDISIPNVPPGANWVPHWVRTLPELKSWLSPQDADNKPTKAEGFLLLAHHTDGNLWFESELDRVVHDSIVRKFSPGSVAILSACSAANPGGDNLVVLKTLNHNGIDAMIVSPFPVRADYGSKLAENLVSVIESERAASRTPTLAEIFEQAAALTAEQVKEFNVTLDEMALEFLLLGDYNIRLCKP